MTEILRNGNFNNLFKDYIGSRVLFVNLIQYVTPDGNMEGNDVELEFVFENGAVLRIMTASDGERVSISHEPWVDSFQEPISDENQRFIKEHGKWSSFDLSSQSPFTSIIGKSILAFEGLQNQFGVLAGVAIFCGEKVLCFCVDGDEGKLFWGKDNPKMIALGFQPLETLICR